MHLVETAKTASSILKGTLFSIASMNPMIAHWLSLSLIALAGIMFAWEIRRMLKTGGGLSAEFWPRILMILLLAALATAQIFAPRFGKPQTGAYQQIVEARANVETENMTAQLANFAAQTGAQTNNWSIPLTGGRGRATPVSTSAVEEAFARETNALVVAVVPTEIKFTAEDGLPQNYNHILVGLHVGQQLTDASLRIEVAVKDNFWQMIQFGEGKATELLVALRGIRLERQQPAWAKQPVLVIKGHAQTVQWFKPVD